MIEFAKGLALPDDAITQTFGIFGRKRSGKSHTACVMAEGMVKAGGQIVVLDPVGVWWGTRHGRDGKRAGLDIVVFGGRNGDMPLEPTAGELVADVVVDHGISAVLDVSPWSWAKRKTFVAQFIERFYHRMQDERRPVHVFLEEAQVFVPQKPQPGEQPMLGRITELVRIGGNYGIGATLISQRPASVSKEVVTQVEALVVHQIPHDRDRKAIREWVVEQDVDTHAELQGLPSLAQGEAYFWSPQWLGIFEKVQVKQKTTFDASATPTVGGKRKAEPRPLQREDREKLRAAMSAVVEEADAKDPAKLRARIRKLEQQLERQSGADPAEIRAQVEDALRGQAEHFAGVLESIRKAIRRLGEEVESLAAAAPPAPIRQEPRRSIPGSIREQVHGRATPPTNTPRLGGGRARMVAALARFYPAGLTVAQWATQSKLQRSGGTWATYVSDLRKWGLIVEQDDLVFASEAGLAAAGEAPASPQSPEEVVAMWRKAVGRRPGEMLDVLVKHYPHWISREELNAELDPPLTVSAGTFSTYLSRLRSNGLIEVRADGLRASADLFTVGSHA